MHFNLEGKKTVKVSLWTRDNYSERKIEPNYRARGRQVEFCEKEHFSQESMHSCEKWVHA